MLDLFSALALNIRWLLYCKRVPYFFGSSQKSVLLKNKSTFFVYKMLCYIQKNSLLKQKLNKTSFNLGDLIARPSEMNNIDDLQLSMNSYDHQILKWDKEGMAMDKQWSDSECSAGLRRFLGSVSLHQKSTATRKQLCECSSTLQNLNWNSFSSWCFYL